MESSYRWVIVGLGALMGCVAVGTMFSLAVFLDPMTAAEGWSRTGISSAATLNFLCMAVGSLVWGAVTDRFGARLVVLSGGALLVAGLLAASQAASLGEFQLLFGVLVGFAVGGFYAPMVSATMAWFTQHRTLAVALVSAGMSFGSMTMAPLARWLITAHDWRTAMVIVGGVALALLLPAGLLLRRPPAIAENGGAAPAQGATSRLASMVDDGPGLSVAQALRTPQFIAIALTHFACCAAHSGPIFHMVSYALICGAAPMAATAVYSLAGLASLGGRVLLGTIADRVGAKPTLVAGLMVQAIAVSLYLLAADLGALYALSVLFGLAYGGVMPLYAVLVRDYFGPRIMGTMFGAVGMVASLGMAFGPWAGGWAFDNLNSYTWLYIGSFAFGLGAVAIALTFRPLPVRVAAPARVVEQAG